jgi:hypothetical protein
LRRGARPRDRAARAAFFLDRLSERNPLALIAFASGYVIAFLVTVVVRAVRLTR